MIVSNNNRQDNECDVCPDDSFQDATGHSLTSCTPHGTCGLDEFAFPVGDATTDFGCTACPAGHDNPDTNHRDAECDRLIPEVLTNIFTEITQGVLSRDLWWFDPGTPADAPITRYELKIKQFDAADWYNIVRFSAASVQMADGGNFDREYFIDETEWNLVPDKLYLVAIRSKNVHGWSPYPEDWQLGTFNSF
jgi:hypothetical protein